MKEEPITSATFRREVENASYLLTSNGFARAPQLDVQTPTTASVVYTGKNVAFVFTLDFRDQAIDLVVMKYHNGELLSTWDGGYSSSLFTHLVNQCGFRGRPVTPASVPQKASRLQKTVAAYMNLLAQPMSAKLLADLSDALPE